MVMNEDDSIVSREVQGKNEEQTEFSLRPQNLKEYLGQTRVKKEMSVYI